MTVVSLSKRFIPAASALALAGCASPDFGYPMPLLGSGEPRAEVKVDPVRVAYTSLFVRAAYKHHTTRLTLQRDIITGNYFKREVDDIVSGVYDILSEEGNCFAEDATFSQCFKNGSWFDYRSPLFEDNMRVTFSDVTEACASYSVTFQTSAAFSEAYDFGALIMRQRCDTETSSYIGDCNPTESLHPSQQGSNPPRP